MVPLALVGGACWSLAVNQLALGNAVHGASRAYVLSPTTGIARARVSAVVASTAARFGIPGGTVTTVIDCSAAACLVPGEYVTVSASRAVTVVMPFVGSRTVVVAARDTAVVDLAR